MSYSALLLTYFHSHVQIIKVRQRPNVEDNMARMPFNKGLDPVRNKRTFMFRKKKKSYLCFSSLNVNFHLSLTPSCDASLSQVGCYNNGIKSMLFPLTLSRYYCSFVQHSSSRCYLKVVICILLVAHLRLGRIYIPLSREILGAYTCLSLDNRHLICYCTRTLTRTWTTT